MGVSFSTFSRRTVGYGAASFAALVYVVANTPSMFFAMSQYYDLGLQRDTTCFEYFRDREWIIVCSVYVLCAVHVLE